MDLRQGISTKSATTEWTLWFLSNPQMAISLVDSLQKSGDLTWWKIQQMPGKESPMLSFLGQTSNNKKWQRNMLQSKWISRKTKRWGNRRSKKSWVKKFIKQCSQKFRTKLQFTLKTTQFITTKILDLDFSKGLLSKMTATRILNLMSLILKCLEIKLN